MTVFFSDMQGFSAISETLTPTALVRLINRYLTYVAEPIALHQGVIDKYISDAVMAYWGTLILADEATVAQVRHRIDVREIDLLAATGKIEAVRIFELLGEVGTVAAAQLELRDAYEAGLASYRAGDWDRAEAAFDDCLRIAPGDGPAATFLDRVGTFRRFSPPEDWGGVWQSVSK